MGISYDILVNTLFNCQVQPLV